MDVSTKPQRRVHGKGYRVDATNKGYSVDAKGYRVDATKGYGMDAKGYRVDAKKGYMVWRVRLMVENGLSPT